MIFTDDQLDGLRATLTRIHTRTEPGDRYLSLDSYDINALLARLDAAEKICNYVAANEIHIDDAIKEAEWCDRAIDGWKRVRGL